MRFHRYCAVALSNVLISRSISIDLWLHVYTDVKMAGLEYILIREQDVILIREQDVIAVMPPVG